MRAGKGTNRAGQNFLTLPHLSTSFEIQKYYQTWSYKLIFSKILWEEWWNNTEILSITIKMKNYFCVICGKYKKMKKLKHHTL